MSALSISTGDFLAAVGIATAPGTFGLSSTRTEAGTSSANNLTWTWPANMLASFGISITWAALTLQYSTTASNRPDPLVVYDVGNHLSPPFDPNWTTLKQWVTYAAYAADNPVPANGAFTHPWPTIQPVAYRLILNFGKGFDPAFPPFVEMTWNIRLIVPVQPLNICQIGAAGCPPAFPGQTGNRLSWNAPDVSWWPGTFLQFVTYTRCPCGPDACHPITGVQAQWNSFLLDVSKFPGLTAYSVLKSVDGVTFSEAVSTANFVMDACNKWYDSGIATPGNTPWYYQFVAHLPDTSLIYSNIIFAN